MISRWESNIGFPSDTLASLIAEELGIPDVEIIDLLTMDKLQNQTQKQATKSKRLMDRIGRRKSLNITASHNTLDDELELIKIPILGTVPAGPLQEALPMARKDAVEFEYIADEGIFNPDMIFGLHVVGESMIGKDIKDGDIIIINTGIQPSNNDVVVAMVNDSATVKTFIKQDDIIILQSANENMAPIILRENDLDHIRIIGKVIRIIKKL
jgi:SOS-response transcriptional repressor LexA